MELLLRALFFASFCMASFTFWYSIGSVQTYLIALNAWSQRIADSPLKKKVWIDRPDALRVLCNATPITFELQKKICLS